MTSLSAQMRDRCIQSLISDVEFIAAWLPGRERQEQAKWQIRESMFQNAIEEICQQEVPRVHSILSFAIPSDYFLSGEKK